MEKRARRVKLDLLKNGTVEELELAYCVHIQTDALDLACSIVERYYDALSCKRGKGHRCTPDTEALKVKVLQLLEKACFGLREDFDEDSELASFDKEEYLLLRDFVELFEVTKEKTLSSCNYLPRVEEEYKVLRDWWDRLAGKCRAVLAWLQNSHRMAQLVLIRERICQILNSETSKDEIIHGIRDILGLISEYKRSIPAPILQCLTVSPLIVAKAASLITGVPTSWLLNSFQPPLDGLRDRLTSRFIGQGHMIKGIMDVLLDPERLKSPPSPLASFLFLRASTFVVSDIIESLAQEIYDSKDRLIRFDLSGYRGCSCGSSVDSRRCRHKRNDIREEVLEAVKNTAFCALLFENVEKGCSRAIDFVDHIVTCGTIEDDEGNIYELTNTLIMFTSTCGQSEHRPVCCKCLDKDEPLKHAAISSLIDKDHDCSLASIYRQKVRTYGGKLLFVDDILVFNYISPLDGDAIARMRLRDVIDAAWEGHRLILHPSEAVVRVIATQGETLGQKGAIRSWLDCEVIPRALRELNNVTHTEVKIVYVDVLVGTMTFSYRQHEINDALIAFKEPLNRWRDVYKQVKRSVDEIYKLRKMTSEMLSLMQDMDARVDLMRRFTDMKRVIDGAIANANAVTSWDFDSNPLLVLLDGIEARLATCQVKMRADMNKMEGLRMVLYGSKEARTGAVDFITESIFTSNAPYDDGKSFLLLGLSENGKAELVEALSELFRTGDDVKLILMNMQEYGESASLVHFLDVLNDLRFSSCSLGNPRQILLIDRVGDAHVSVFSALLSVLDRSATRNSKGGSIDFQNTVFIIMSDLANKKVLARLVGPVSVDGIKEGSSNQPGERPFRWELLNRVDEILTFNPHLKSQLQRFSRLPMKVGQCCDMLSAVSILFEDSDSPGNKVSTVLHLSQVIFRHCNNAVFNRKNSLLEQKLEVV